MRVSLSITQYPQHPNGPGHTPLEQIVQAADEGGLDTVWVADHLVQHAPDTDPTDPILEAFTTLGWLAAHSSRVRLGTMVAAVTFRPATVLIKAVSALAVLSDGRAWLGVGTGYDEREATGMGLPLPPLAERYERLEDTVALAHRMWAGDESPFTGARVRAERPINRPNPAHRPRVLIGGGGEKRTLPLVARYADACNLPDIPDGGVTLRRKLDVLAEECEKAGRSPHEIEKTVSTLLPPDESPTAFARRCAALAELGLDHAVVITREPWNDDDLARLVEGARLAGPIAAEPVAAL